MTTASRSDRLERWGFAFLLTILVVSWVQLLMTGASGHYDFFSASARFIWEGKNPYGISYPSGYFNYSPAAALVFYAPFAYLPYSVGLGLYIASTSALLVWGLRRFNAVLGLSGGAAGAFYFLLASEAIGTVLNARMELLITGATLLSTAWLARGERRLAAWLLLAAVTNFKLQSLPTAGLLAVALVFSERRPRAFLELGSALAFWFALPFALRPWDFLDECHRVWMEYLLPVVGNECLQFQNLVTVLNYGLGLPVDCADGRVWGLIAAPALAVACAWQSFRGKRAEGLAFAAAMGAGYSLVFSPMGQSAAFVQYAPLLAYVVWKAAALKTPARRRIAWAVVIVSWAFVSVAYSDLVPKDFRAWAFHRAFKAAGVTFLLIQALALTDWRRGASPKSP